jgi:hypothetical protein
MVSMEDEIQKSQLLQFDEDTVIWKTESEKVCINAHLLDGPKIVPAKKNVVLCDSLTWMKTMLSEGIADNASTMRDSAQDLFTLKGSAGGRSRRTAHAVQNVNRILDQWPFRLHCPRQRCVEPFEQATPQKFFR